MQTLTVTVGLPGAGKTTWTREQMAASRPGWVARLNRDSLRAMLHDGKYAPAGRTEEQVVAMEKLAVPALFTSGAQRVIVDDTNLGINTLRNWRQLALDLTVRFEIVSFLDVPVSACLHRNVLRPPAARVPADKLQGMHNRLVPPVRKQLARWRAGIDGGAVVRAA
jgi:predicted kinase